MDRSPVQVWPEHQASSAASSCLFWTGIDITGILQKWRWFTLTWFATWDRRVLWKTPGAVRDDEPCGAVNLTHDESQVCHFSKSVYPLTKCRAENPETCQ